MLEASTFWGTKPISGSMRRCLRLPSGRRHQHDRDPFRGGEHRFLRKLCYPTDQIYLAMTKVGKLATHTMRHSYRSWLDAVGTLVAVQQKLMWHADIRTTVNIYGVVVTNQESEAHSKIVGLALPRA
jgi:integrase